MERWAKKVAVVTGASSGIGLATAKALVRNGLTVVGLARNGARMKDRSNDIRERTVAGGHERRERPWPISRERMRHHAGGKRCRDFELGLQTLRLAQRSDKQCRQYDLPNNRRLAHIRPGECYQSEPDGAAIRNQTSNHTDEGHSRRRSHCQRE
ncbi:uncharacterized protein LOC131675677 [Phymastichus coffea]|uniref:uncharacterized protein LOC131675677 n=1 Tax=Phymastichus coffea TaxID=108790 RepID=UPI00273C34BF|nr:uncharacterized protein LOC131675677 [Phymastichus coffea]